MNRWKDSWQPKGWGLHLHAHRGLLAVGLIGLLHLAALLGPELLPLMSLNGVVEVPTVTVLAVMIAPVSVWSLQERTRLERVSTQPLRPVGELAVWLAALAPCLAVASPVYARALLAAMGLSMLVWQRWPSALAALPVVVWFVLSAAFARVAPGLPWWGCFVYEGDARTWVVPAAFVALAAVTAGLRAVRR